MRAPVTAAWTSLTSTCVNPVSQVMARSASRSASRWTPLISFCGSTSVIGTSGCLRSCEWVVVNPLTSSPAMPMTHCVGRNPAISSASCSATEQLSTTALISVTVPDCICARPWRLRPTPRTVPMSLSSISKTSALTNSVPMSSAVQAARADSSSWPQILRQNATGRSPICRLFPCRSKCIRDRSHGRRDSISVRSHALGHLRPAAAAPRHRAHRDLDQLPGRDPTLDQILADRDEYLRRLGVEGEGDHARTDSGANLLDVALPLFGGVEGAAVGHELDARSRFIGVSGDVGGFRQAAAAGTEPTPRFLELFL